MSVAYEYNVFFFKHQQCNTANNQSHTDGMSTLSELSPSIYASLIKIDLREKRAVPTIASINPIMTGFGLSNITEVFDPHTKRNAVLIQAHPSLDFQIRATLRHTPL